MPKGEAGLFVQYCAKDFLDGTNTLKPWEELAYRRICDLIYDTNDRLADDDRMLAWATKTGRRWPEIKKVLTSGERPKLIIVGGRISNLRCQSALATATQKIAQKRGAGRASAETRKSLKNLKRHGTGVEDPFHEPLQRSAERNQESTEPEEKNTLTGVPKEPADDPVEVDPVEPVAACQVSSARARPKRQIPVDWVPTEEGVSYALDRAGWVHERLIEEVEHFKDHHRANKNAFADDSAAWRNWVRIGIEKQSRNRNGRQSAHAAETAAFDAITRH